MIQNGELVLKANVVLESSLNCCSIEAKNEVSDEKSVVSVFAGALAPRKYRCSVGLDDAEKVGWDVIQCHFGEAIIGNPCMRVNTMPLEP